MAEITVAADLDSLNDVLAFVDGEMERAGCSMKLMTQVDMAVEEIFVNIARYAYHPEAGEASVRCEAGGDPFQIVVGFADRGRPFNPLDREDPDVTLDAEARHKKRAEAMLQEARRTMEAELQLCQMEREKGCTDNPACTCKMKVDTHKSVSVYFFVIEKKGIFRG